MPNSLFGHLALHFTSSPENLASEALCYILNGSPAASEAFLSLLGHYQAGLSQDLRFETQGHSTHDSSIPDLVGKDVNGKEILLGEAKFWAGLTENQPVTYLQRLAQEDGKVLVLFAPSLRFPQLWPELQARCNLAGIAWEEIASLNPEILAAKTQPDKTMILMSWRALLSVLHQILLARGELSLAGDVFQLQGLCEQMDTEAFLPLQSEELTSQVSRRYMQYCDLVDEVTDRLVADHLASTRGLKATGNRSGYVRYMRIQEHGVSLGFNTTLWSKYRPTPIWLGIQSNNWEFDADARKRLISLEIEVPPRLFHEGKVLYIPLLLETAVEKSRLVESIVGKINEIITLLVSDH